MVISSRTKALAHSQQAVLQLLVLIQEQERKYLVKLVRGVSLEDLQGPDCTLPPKEGKPIFSSFSHLSELFFIYIHLMSVFLLFCFLSRES